jgi:hypothetical protein
MKILIYQCDYRPTPKRITETNSPLKRRNRKEKNNKVTYY